MAVMDTRVLLSQPLLPAITRAGWVLEGGGCSRGLAPLPPPPPGFHTPGLGSRTPPARQPRAPRFSPRTHARVAVNWLCTQGFRWGLERTQRPSRGSKGVSELSHPTFAGPGLDWFLKPLFHLTVHPSAGDGEGSLYFPVEYGLCPPGGESSQARRGHIGGSVALGRWGCRSLKGISPYLFSSLCSSFDPFGFHPG